MWQTLKYLWYANHSAGHCITTWSKPKSWLISFLSCWVSTVKQNFNPNFCTKIKSKDPVNGLTAPNKNNSSSACKTVFLWSSSPVIHTLQPTLSHKKHLILTMALCGTTIWQKILQMCCTAGLKNHYSRTHLCAFHAHSSGKTLSCNIYNLISD